MSEEMSEPPPADAASPSAAPTALAAIAREAGQRRGPAPVHLWNPPYCGDIGLEIRVDGSWWYQNSRIGRESLVALFASVLRKDEDGATYLVTPAEKILVRVADAPFLAVEMAVGAGAPSRTATPTLTATPGGDALPLRDLPNSGLLSVALPSLALPSLALDVRTNLGDMVSIGPDHPLRFEIEPGTGGLKPYVTVRGRLDARFTRALTLDLMTFADLTGPQPGIWSRGQLFPLPPDALG